QVDLSEDKRSTPTRIELAPGKYSVTITGPARTETFPVEIAAGRRLPVNKNLGGVDHHELEKEVQELGAAQALSASHSSCPSPPASRPQPVRPAPAPVPVPVQPVGPAIDSALRQQVANEINSARGRMAAAQQRKAGAAPQFAQATQALAEANTRSATAKSNDD